jgi:uncharacterized protein YbaR (Trm112 family)
VIGEELLRLLACPLCKMDVHLEDERIVCPECGRRYPVRDGIPIMLVEEAERPDGTEFREEEPETHSGDCT